MGGGAGSRSEMDCATSSMAALRVLAAHGVMSRGQQMRSRAYLKMSSALGGNPSNSVELDSLSSKRDNRPCVISIWVMA